MAIHQLKLIGRREIARNTTEFKFNKPANFTFIPGQYAGFTLINPGVTDVRGVTRRFSLANIPDDDFIAIALRIIEPSAYKRLLNQLVIGDEIKFAGPTGNFILPNETNTPVILIAGGIGITPFYSMIREASKYKSPRDITLFYGNQTREESAYLDELYTLQKENPHFNFIPTLAVPDDHWQGETGFISDIMIRKYVPDLQKPFYYVCGSSVMVTTLQETLAEMGINEDNIKVEDFPGY